MQTSLQADYRVLVLAPFGKDGLLTREVLERSGIPVGVVQAVSAVARCVGGGAGAAVVAEEALDEEGIECLGRAVSTQPAWSDFPIIVLTGGGATTPYTEMMVRSRTPMGNITLIERPLRPATLVSCVRTAIRSRMRQYELRNYLEERELAAAELLRAHDELETLVEKRTLALRRLSAKIMRVQDEERRRIARELHDGLGQWLAAAQINLDIELLQNGSKSSSVLQETRKLVDHAVSSIRTMSYLLHPPLLDEAGFEAAAHWFIDGFTKRTAMGVNTNFSHPDCRASEALKTSRMPDVVELALFRALQEGLINAHRHSGSQNVDVKFERLPELATLEIEDFGRGLPSSVMERFQRTGTGSGVGLAGIRERLKELGGDFTIASNDAGTKLRASVPLGSKPRTEHEAASTRREVAVSDRQGSRGMSNVPRLV
jgi:signal transduction histidine kinase